MVIPRAIIRDLHTGVEATRLMSLVMLVSQRVADPRAADRQRADRAVRLARGVRRGDDRRAARRRPARRLRAARDAAARGSRRASASAACSRGFGQLLRDRRFLGLTFIGGLGMSSFFAFLASSSFVYIDHFGLTPTQYSLAFSVNAVGFIGASQFAARARRRGSAWPRVVVTAVARLRRSSRCSCSA